MRIIDGDELRRELIRGHDLIGAKYVDLAPSIEIIRCRECKRANYEWSGVRCGLSDVLMGEDGFCSIGERNE